MRRPIGVRRETCIICGAQAPAGWTCGSSYCQEADYHTNRAQNASQRDAKAAWAIAGEKTSIALDMAGRRSC